MEKVKLTYMRICRIQYTSYDLYNHCLSVLAYFFAWDDDDELI